MRLFLLFISIGGIVLLDMVSKVLFEKMLKFQDIEIIGDYIRFELSYNSGIAFSFPLEGTFLKIVTIGVLFSLFYYFFTTEYPKKDKIIDIGFICIFGGALSHAYERIFIGHVIDFLSIKYFAIVNIADIFISVGAIFLIFSYVRMNRRNG